MTHCRSRHDASLAKKLQNQVLEDLEACGLDKNAILKLIDFVHARQTLCLLGLHVKLFVSEE